MKLTIDKNGYNIVARDEQGNVKAARKTNCNPAALRQIILDVEMLGAEIDWDKARSRNPMKTKCPHCGGAMRLKALIYQKSLISAEKFTDACR